jgi:hypothetical protein
VQYPIQVDVADGTAPFECALLDISEKGARILSDAPQKIADQVVLLLGQRGARRRCKVVWRKGNEIGLEFVKERVLTRKAVRGAPRGTALVRK